MEKDTIFVLTEGAYSDYQIQGTYIALVDFDPAQITNEWIRLNPEQGYRYKADISKFNEWLVSSGFIKKHKVAEWHIGAYDSFGECPSFYPDASAPETRVELEIEAQQ